MHEDSRLSDNDRIFLLSMVYDFVVNHPDHGRTAEALRIAKTLEGVDKIVYVRSAS